MRLNTEVNTESIEENFDGDVQENLGQVDIDSSFQLVNALVARPIAGPLMVITL